MSNIDDRKIELIAKAGYWSKTLVYSVLGVLIVWAAFGSGSVENISKETVFKELQDSSYGNILLGALMLGLACYVVWRLSQASFNLGGSDDDNSKAKDIMLRVFYFVSAVLYASVCYTCYKIWTYSDTSSGGGSSNGMIQSMLDSTWGPILFGAIGVIVIGFGFVQFKHTFTGDCMDKLNESKMSSEERKSSSIAGRIGFATRGVLYFMVGGIFLNASMTSGSAQKDPLSQSLITIAEQPFGPYLLGAVGLGLISFAVFCAFEGLYRKV